MPTCSELVQRALKMYGYASMPTVPNATVFATATATSLFSASMAGARAVMAVTPQILVPAVRSKDILRGRPASVPIIGMVTRPAPTAPRTTGMPEDPVERSSKNDSFAATQTIPVWSTVLVAKVRPGLTLSGSGTTPLFLMAIPCGAMRCDVHVRVDKGSSVKGQRTEGLIL